MFDERFVRRQRFSAVVNGVMIGFGLMMGLVIGDFTGLFPLGVGVLIEWWQRRRLHS